MNQVTVRRRAFFARTGKKRRVARMSAAKSSGIDLPADVAALILATAAQSFQGAYSRFPSSSRKHLRQPSRHERAIQSETSRFQKLRQGRLHHFAQLGTRRAETE